MQKTLCMRETPKPHPLSHKNTTSSALTNAQHKPLKTHRSVLPQFKENAGPRAGCLSLSRARVPSLEEATEMVPATAKGGRKWPGLTEQGAEGAAEPGPPPSGPRTLFSVRTPLPDPHPILPGDPKAGK